MNVQVSGEVDPCIWVILDHWDFTCPPFKKKIIKSLYGPPSTLFRKQRCPPTHCWEQGYMPPYCLYGTETGHPLKEEALKNCTKPKALVGKPLTLCNLSLHACQHGHTPVKNGGLQTLNDTMHVPPRGLVKGCRSSNLPDQN
jgi:hypothetical protein